MGFKYQLATSDGELFAEADYAYKPQAGDELRIDGNRKVRVVSVVPLERMGEFVDGSADGFGLLEVEPI